MYVSFIFRLPWFSFTFQLWHLWRMRRIRASLCPANLRGWSQCHSCSKGRNVGAQAEMKSAPLGDESSRISLDVACTRASMRPSHQWTSVVLSVLSTGKSPRKNRKNIQGCTCLLCYICYIPCCFPQFVCEKPSYTPKLSMLGPIFSII